MIISVAFTFVTVCTDNVKPVLGSYIICYWNATMEYQKSIYEIYLVWTRSSATYILASPE